MRTCWGGDLVVTSLAAKKKRTGQEPVQDIGHFVANLLDLTKNAEGLGMHRVTLCLQYAYWEALCEASPGSVNELN